MQLVNPVNRAVPIYTTLYEKFRGVDMRADPAKIDNTRSPFAPNLTVDSGGFPEKRLGYRDLTSVEAPINGLYYVDIGNTDFYIIHGGTKLYRWNGTQSGVPTVIKSDVCNACSTGFVMNKKFWILTGNDYLMYDGTYLKSVVDIATIPTTVIGRLPGGGDPNSPEEKAGSGGTFYEPINLLQKKQTNAFLGDGTTKIYMLTQENLDSDLVTIEVDETTKAELTDFFVDRQTGAITFSIAPPAPKTVGKDNVFITFAKTVLGYSDRIRKCSICSTYGLGGNNRIFMSGNPDMPATDWYSGLNDPSYMADTDYSVVGSDNSAIMGYCKIGEYLAVIKEDNTQDSTIFLRSASTTTVASESNISDIVFPLKQGVTGEGAISKKAIGKLSDEPLFLSRNGIYAITSNMVTAERTVQNRSWFVDPMLTKEPHLEKAVCTEWNGQFIVCVNSNCYILDGKQTKSYVSQAKGDYVYECYHWNNIPAVCFLERNGDLYFGTNNGKVCRFNNDIALMAKYSDNGKAIKCSWQTKADYDGDFTRYKSMPKKGCALMLKPYTRSSCNITIRTDKDFGKFIRTQYNDIFSFEDLDFTRLSFNTNDGPQVIPFNKKVKKYITAQIIVSNDVLNEGFGILGIIKRYTKGDYVRK